MVKTLKIGQSNAAESPIQEKSSTTRAFARRIHCGYCIRNIRNSCLDISFLFCTFVSISLKQILMKLNTKDKNCSGIYVIRNILNKKIYVGKAKCIYRRVKDHITRLNHRSKDENPHLINAWHKYGKDNFEYFVIEYLQFDEELLKKQELHWMEKLDSINREKGYNLRLDSETGMIVSEETREKCRQSQIERYSDPKEREKSAKASKKFWEENPEIKEQMRKNLAKNRRIYRIAKINKETGEILKIYENVFNIHEDHPDFYLQAIKGCCSGSKRSYKGFLWKYAKLDEDILA